MLSASCELETSDNGKLDGYWHLETVDTIATGGHNDVSSRHIFWAVQGKILQLYNTDTTTTYVFRFEHTGGKLSLSDARRDYREQNDPVVTDVSVLAPFGVNSLEESFTVEQLTGSRLTLVSEALRLKFRKF